jgi:glycosyltransferase involved in cell wall biosynthesis
LNKIVYIHQYFKTPEEGGAIRSYHISKGMVDREIKVDMITSHNKPKYEKKTIDGIHVHYLPVNYSNELSSKGRYIAFFKFVLAAVRLSQKLQKPDLCFATSTPLTVGMIALWLKWTQKIPYVFEVRDLWPEAPIQLGIIKSVLLKHLSIRFEKVIYKNANRIIALSLGIEKGIVNKYGKVKISMIPNMADIDFFHKKPPKIPASPAGGHEKGDFIIGYFGAFGMANNLEYILDVAEECQKANLPVAFKLIGDGARKNAIKFKATQMNLKNVEILPHRNRFETRTLMEKVDACFTSFLTIPILETNSPNKFFDGLAAGKLNIVNTQGWLRELVEQNKCGFYTDPDKPEKFPLLIEPFIQDKNILNSYQENALRLGKTTFSKDKLVHEVCDLVLSVCS